MSITYSILRSVHYRLFSMDRTLRPIVYLAHLSVPEAAKCVKPEKMLGEGALRSTPTRHPSRIITFTQTSASSTEHRDLFCHWQASLASRWM
jgi:hypothetical protein